MRQRSCFSLVTLLSAIVISLVPNSATSVQRNRNLDPKISRIKVGSASLYARVIGKGQPVIVLHGGSDFDHSYLLPDLDRLKESFRLIYYDQRGRGRSADNVRPEDVTLTSDLSDIDTVRQHFRLDSVVLLGHSWGTVLALEYALRHAERVSHLILMKSRTGVDGRPRRIP